MKVMIVSLILVIAAMTQKANARILQTHATSQTKKGKAIMPIKRPISNSTLRGSNFASAASVKLPYQGGPVMLGTINVYYIWYGNWSSLNPGAIPLLEKFAANIGGSPYWNIQTTYFDSQGNHMSNSVSFKGSVTYPQFSSSLLRTDIETIVVNTIKKKTLPLNTNGVYFVFTASDIDVNDAGFGFCGQYCGWHDWTQLSGQYIKYAFVCPDGCSYQQPGPNSNTGADGMANIIANLLEETATDPLGNAWRGSTAKNADAENAAICAGTFGATKGSSGRKYNVNFGGTNFLIQQNFILTDTSGNGYCGLSVKKPTSKPTVKPNKSPTKRPTKPTRHPTPRPTSPLTCKTSRCAPVNAGGVFSICTVQSANPCSGGSFSCLCEVCAGGICSSTETCEYCG